MTFTLLAADTDHGLLGVATASKSLAAGRSVPAIDPTCGAVASQAWTNRKLRHHMLAKLRAGASAPEAVQGIGPLDDNHAFRQVSVIDLQGRVGAHTGDLTSEWAGHHIGDQHVASGNLIAGPHVLSAMSKAFVSAQRPQGTALSPWLDFTQRVLGALEAGEAAGGDKRGRESSALMIAKVSTEWFSPPELMVDLRVDHHVEPVTELNSLLNLLVQDIESSSDAA